MAAHPSGHRRRLCGGVHPVGGRPTYGWAVGAVTNTIESGTASPQSGGQVRPLPAPHQREVKAKVEVNACTGASVRAGGGRLRRRLAGAAVESGGIGHAEEQRNPGRPGGMLKERFPDSGDIGIWFTRTSSGPFLVEVGKQTMEDATPPAGQ